MIRALSWLAFMLVAAVLSVGCAGDEKDANKNKEKPQPAAK